MERQHEQRRTRWRGRAGVVAVALLAGVVGLPVADAGATTSVTLYVSTSGGATTGCSSSGTGACATLAEAIAAAQLLSGDVVTIDVAAGTYATNVDVSTGSPTITIQGAGAGTTILNGGGESEGTNTVVVGYDTDVTINDVTLEDGDGSSYGGDVIAEGTLALNDDTITAGYGGDGGGAIYLTGTTTMANDTVSDNDGYDGGSIADYGSLTVTDTTFSANTATSYAGAIFVYTGKSLTADDDTFSGNSASGDGGAVLSNGDATLDDDTFLNNAAGTEGGGEGGAFFSNNTSAVTTMEFDTLADNTAPEYGGGVFSYSASSLTIADSILQSSTCAYEAASTPITDGGHNVESTDTCGFGGSSLVDNSSIHLSSTLAGATSTVPGDLPLIHGSSAIGLVPAADCDGVNATDEQGVSRLTGGATSCDAGASAVVTTPVVAATVPSAPRSPKAVAGNGSIKLSWTAPSSTGGDPLTLYRVYCSTTRPVSTKGKDTLTVKASVRSVTVPRLKNGVHYTCVVTAVNAVGSSASSPNASATPKK